MGRNASLLSPGQVVSETYEVERLLGAGGMGEVWLAKHRRLAGKQVAIKVMHLGDGSGSPELLARFRREAEIAARLDHPNIVQVLDFDALPSGAPFLVMEYLKGESLASRARGQPMPLDDVRAVVRQVGSALAAAHAAGVVHRDLKPDNIFLVPTALGDQVKVLDFGISKLSESSTLQTTDAVLMGTPRYMSPEQALGRNRDLTAQSDLFSLGAICYELLSGQPPFEAETVAQLVFRIAYEPHPPLARAAPQLPPDAVLAIERALTKDVTLRTPDIATFVLELTGTPLASVAPSGVRHRDSAYLDTGTPLTPSLAEGATHASPSAAVASQGLRSSASALRGAAPPELPPTPRGAPVATPAPGSTPAQAVSDVHRPRSMPRLVSALLVAVALSLGALVLIKLRSVDSAGGGPGAQAPPDAGAAPPGLVVERVTSSAPGASDAGLPAGVAWSPQADVRSAGNSVLDGGTGRPTSIGTAPGRVRPGDERVGVTPRGPTGQHALEGGSLSEAEAELAAELNERFLQREWVEVVGSLGQRVLQAKNPRFRARMLPYIIEAACHQRQLPVVKDHLERLRALDPEGARKARRKCLGIYRGAVL